MLVPSAVMPPSAKSRPWTSSTTARHSAAVYGPDQHRGERAAEQVPAGAGADREVDHLGGEHERRDQARHGGGTVVEFTAGAPQRDRDTGRGDDARGHRGRGVEEAVGDVHDDHSTLLQH